MHDIQLVQRMLHECTSLDLLYVEDNLILSKNTQEMLQPFFNSIVAADNGEEGLSIYKKGRFDIVLTDIIMPKLDGCKMARLIRDINPEQAIVVMSAYEDAEYFMEMIDIGINKFIPKPPRIEQLFNFLIATAVNINNSKKVAALNAEMKQDLAESKELLRSIIDTVPVRIFWKDRESKYLGCNTLFAQDAQLSDQSELIGKSDHELPWKQQAQSYIDDDLLVMNSGKEKLHYEEEQTLSDGSTVWVSTSKVPLKGGEGETIGILGSYIDITQNKAAFEAVEKAKDALGHQAEHDALTGLPNRLLYLDRLRQAIKKMARVHQKAAVIFIDLDRFKEINDSLGHEIGDHIVKLLGRRLKSELRETDTVARFGGDEFVILIESVNTLSDVAEIVEKVLLSMERPFEVDDHQLHLTLSAGVSIFPDDGENAEILIRNADTAMYRAKDEGRNTYQFYTKEMTQKSFAHMMMAKNIRSAIENREFVLYYQPQIDANTHTLCGMEALVRWNSPGEGFISPGAFIPIAEDSGLIDKIGEYVFTEAATQVSAWYAKGLNPGRMSINLSTIELQRSDFVESIRKKLIELECKPEWIELEITEGYTMKHPDAAINILQHIKDLGIHLSIDDFGTGYSSLSYLKRLPVHKLKIDQSFVRDIPGNPNDEAIVESIISLAKTMEFDVIAEGVETQAQQDFLINKGCHKAQGYLHARPMPLDEIEKFLERLSATGTF